MNFMKSKLSLSLTVIITSLLLFSCMTNTNLRNRYKKIETGLYKGNVNQALKALEESKTQYSDEDLVLYELDKGILSYYNGDYKNTQKYLQRADRRIEENYTSSVSKAVLSAVSNDYAMAYAGENYEHAYVNLFKALAFIEQGNTESAFIEIRRMNEKFKDFSVRNAAEIEKVKQEGIQAKNNELDLSDYPFTSSTMGHYLSMLLYRSDDNPDDARIDKMALMGLSDGPDALFHSNPANNLLRTEIPSDSGIIDIIALCDGGPYKSAWEIEALSVGKTITLKGRNPNFEKTFFYTTEQDISFKFSIPRIKKRQQKVAAVNIYLNGIPYGTTYELEDFASIAVKAFNNNNTALMIRSFLRGIGKAIAAKKITEDWDKKKNEKDKKGNSTGASIFASIMSSATKAAINSTEQADLRCWRLMPSRAEINQLVLPYGTYDLRLDFVRSDGTLIKSVNKTQVLNKDSKLNIVSAYAF